jgi:hypothetical protein
MIKLNYHYGFPMYKNIVTDHPITVVQVGFDQIYSICRYTGIYSYPHGVPFKDTIAVKLSLELDTKISIQNSIYNRLFLR